MKSTSWKTGGCVSDNASVTPSGTMILMSVQDAWIDLWPTAPGSVTFFRPFGLPDVEYPKFLGAPVSKLEVSRELEEIRHWPTGANYPYPRHLGESHIIRMGKIWIIQETGNPGDSIQDMDFEPPRNEMYFLRVAWFQGEPKVRSQEDIVWHTRVWGGVTCPRINQNSSDTVESYIDQEFRASFLARDKGLELPPANPTIYGGDADSSDMS
jgi:hypothetical protein